MSQFLSDKNKTKFWIAFRLLFSRSVVKQGSAQLAFTGLVLGVAALVAAMAVMSGFEETLKVSLTDVTGHIQIVRRGRIVDEWSDFSQKLKTMEPRIQSLMRFAYAEAVLAHQGKVSGVLFQGVEAAEMKSVLSLEKRIKAGNLQLDGGHIVVGQGLAKRFQLKIGDSVFVVVPLATPFENSGFRRQTRQFKISAVMDFGKNDWNERLVIGDLKALQDLTEIGNRYTGAFARLSHVDDSQEAAIGLMDKLGPGFSVMDWFEVNRNLFEAVKIERIIIFFVVLLIVVVAAFNITSTLYVFIRQRYSDIAILKTLGLSSSDVKKVFVGQGILVGITGTAFGILLGFLFCIGFMFLQNHYSLISGAVYKIDEIKVHIRFLDILAIAVATILLSILATFSPAQKGSELEVVEGLKNG